MPSNSSERIDDGLRELSREVLPPGHMRAMMGRVEVDVRRKNKMTRTIRRAALATGLCVVILAGLVFIPVSYDLRVGSVVRAEIPATEANLARLSAGLPHVDGLVFSNVEHGEEDIVLRLGFWRKSAEEAEALVDGALAELAMAPGGYEITAEDIVERIGGNVIAWASGGWIQVNGEGMSEEELELAIVQALIDNGAASADVNIEMSDDGVSRIDISVGEMDRSVPGDSITIEIINSSPGGSDVIIK